MTKPLSQDEIRRHDVAYQRGCDLIENELLLADSPALDKPSWWTKFKLRRAIAAFEEAISLYPSNWSAHWVVGKIYQRLGDYDAALQRFSRAHELEPTNADVVREATIAAIDVGNGTAATRFAEAALGLSPDDAGLMANHALALLIAGDALSARRTIQKSIERDASDQVSRRVAEIIEEVVSGQRPQPRSGRDLG